MDAVHLGIFLVYIHACLHFCPGILPFLIGKLICKIQRNMNVERQVFYVYFSQQWSTPVVLNLWSGTPVGHYVITGGL